MLAVIRLEKLKKLVEKKNRWDCKIHFKKILTRAIFLLAPAANMPATSQFPIG